ncbi:MAG TPA: hypothetical protein VIY10_21840 [Solirubrobacteraceae bacterium]
MINASELVGAPQIAGVVVSPVGLYREIESRTTAFTGGVVVSGKLGPAIGDKLGGKSAAEERSRDATVSDSTPECGKWGFLAVTDAELALTTTAAPKWVGRQLGELVIRVPRSTVAQAELAGGWGHPTYYMFGSAPLCITFTDATAWTFEINRFARRGARRVVHALHDR